VLSAMAAGVLKRAQKLSTPVRFEPAAQLCGLFNTCVSHNCALIYAGLRSDCRDYTHLTQVSGSLVGGGGMIRIVIAVNNKTALVDICLLFVMFRSGQLG
jgi:hypothetical protein